MIVCQWVSVVYLLYSIQCRPSYLDKLVIFKNPDGPNEMAMIGMTVRPTKLARDRFFSFDVFIMS